MSEMKPIGKSDVILQAKKYGVKAGYSGGAKAFYISGDDTLVKSFIRVMNLKGKKVVPYALKQASNV